jgi:hypothetical protein
MSRGLIFALLCLLASMSVLGYFVNDYMEYKQENIAQKRMDNYLKELLEKINNRKNVVLTASILLSNDRGVKYCLKENNRNKCVKYLKHIQDTFNKISFSQDTMIHVHTADFKSFFRVWDLENNENDSLVSFRDSLQYIKETKKENSGIEVGRFSMLIRGISPVIENDEYLGSIEVISNFDRITSYFKKIDLDFYVLMNKKYEKIAEKVNYSRQKKVNDYIVVNNVNSELNVFRDIEFKGTGFVKKNNFYIVYTPIYDINNEKIGFYALKVLASKLF